MGCIIGLYNINVYSVVAILGQTVNWDINHSIEFSAEPWWLSGKVSTLEIQLVYNYCPSLLICETLQIDNQKLD